MKASPELSKINPNIYFYQISFDGVNITGANPGYLLLGSDTLGADVFGIFQDSQFVKIILKNMLKLEQVQVY